MLAEPQSNPFLGSALSIQNVPPFGGASDNAFKAHPWTDDSFITTVQHLPIAGITENEPVVIVVVGKPLGDAFDGLGKPLITACSLQFGLLQRGDVIKPQNALAADPPR